MDTPLNGPGSYPGHKNGDRVIPLSNYTRAPRMPEQRKTEESLVQDVAQGFELQLKSYKLGNYKL